MMEEKITRIFNNISKSAAFERRFFKKLSETENPYPWFEELRKRNYLQPSNNKNPKLEGNNYSVPYWQVLGYLENVAKHVAEKPDDTILGKLLDTIDSIIDYKDDGHRIENPHTDWMIIKTIYKLPIKCITEKHIQFIETALSGRWSNTVLISSEIEKAIFPFLIENKSKALLLKLLEIIIKPQKNKMDNFFETSIMDEYWFSEAIKKNKKKLTEICGLDTAKIVIEQIKAILAENVNRFNIASIPTIEDNQQTMFPDKYECQLVYLVRDAFELTNPDLQKELLGELLQSQYSVLKRIGIHIINYYYSAFSSVFWSLKDNPLQEVELTHEIYELLKSHVESFSKEQFGKIIEWIEGICYKPPAISSEDTDAVKKREAYIKRIWLTAVIDSNNPEIKKLHEKYYQINPAEIEHPGFIFWSSGVVVSTGDAKPFPKELLDLSNQEIAEYINDYEPEERKLFELYGTFADSFRRSVCQNHQKFTQDMSPFLRMPLEYQYALLSGVSEAWIAGKSFSWKELFNFILDLVTQPKFWTEDDKHGNVYKRSMLNKIGDLISNGTNNDDHAFDVEYFSLCEKILLILGEKSKSEIEDNVQDVIQAVLNSTLGNIYSAMVSYSLRYARVLRTSTEDKWADSIKEHFGKALSTGRTTEFDVSLGKFLPNLAFLDKNWVIHNINHIFHKDNEKSWTNGFSSYLFYTTSLSKELYFLLKENQHYQRALKTKFKEPAVASKLSQIICMAYLNDLESLANDSLVSELIRNENIEYLSDLVFFLWRLREKISEEQRKKVKPLWKSIMTFLLSQKDMSKYQKVLAHISYWLSLVDEIDPEVFEWIRISTKYIRESDEIFFTEYLLNHVAKTPEFVGKIFYEVVKEQKYFLKYKKNQIIEIMEKLYELNQTEIAKRICNLYLDGGYDFLRKTCEKHNLK